MAVVAAAALGGLSCADIFGPTTPLNFVAVDAGGYHTCGITLTGDVFCWGKGNRGELGNFGVEDSARPVQAGRDIVYTQITLGEQHTCALSADGEIHCWGWNAFGQLGIGSRVGYFWPEPIRGTGLTFTRVTAGWYHTCALTTTGEAYCWGSNGQGQHGNGTTDASDDPVPVAGGHTFVDLSAGTYHTCGVTTGGTALCWGLNFLGQLGDGTTFTRYEPVAVAGGITFGSISVGFTHSCGLAPDGQAYCWGSNQHGELGDSGISPYALPGTTVPGLVNQSVHGGLTFRQIDAGLGYTCAVATTGKAYCWGQGQEGQLGNGWLEKAVNPREVFATTDMAFTAVSAGSGRHTCGITSTFAAFCWGSGEFGALGPATTYAAQPVRISGTR